MNWPSKPPTYMGRVCESRLALCVTSVLAIVKLSPVAVR